VVEPHDDDASGVRRTRGELVPDQGSLPVTVPVNALIVEDLRSHPGDLAVPGDFASFSKKSRRAFGPAPGRFENPRKEAGRPSRQPRSGALAAGKGPGLLLQASRAISMAPREACPPAADPGFDARRRDVVAAMKRSIVGMRRSR